MNWENLKAENCPYDGAPVVHNDGEIHCTSCTFKITEERAQNIIRTRGNPDGKKVSYYWQNLVKDCCPIDNYFLIEESGPYRILKCTNAECTFRIRQDTYDKILADPYHPANRFHE